VRLLKVVASGDEAVEADAAAETERS